jgi:TolB protein
VFSEPIDAATLTASSVELSLDGAPVAGTLAFGDTAHLTVTFTPDEPLATGGEYTLLVTQAIEDLDGDALEAPATVGFATGGPPLPPGTQLAFVRDGQIHLVNSDGTGVVRLSDGPADANPAWSPDGRRLAFARSRPAPAESTDIYLMDADGANLVRRAAFRFADSPSWSPDGQWVVFAGFNPIESSTPGMGSMDIFVVKADDDGTSPINLTDQPGWEAHPAWSPGGTHIAYVSDWVAYDFTADIFTMAPDGSQRTQLTDGFGYSGSLVQYYRPAWSPDGQRIAVVTCLIGFETCSASTVSVMNADGSGLGRIAATIGWDGATWSPDGQTIAFGSAGSIYWVAADRSALGVIVTNGHSPAWRP